MYAQFYKHHAVRQPSVGRLAIEILSVSLVTLLAAMPATRASASPSTPGIAVPATVSALPSGEVEELLAGIPLDELSATQLTEALSKLPSLSTLSTVKLKEALSNTIASLTNKNATVGKLLEPTEIVPTLEAELKKLLLPSELLSMLKGESLTTKLSGALGSLDPSQLLDKLLSSSTTPEQLLTQLFATLNPESLLGTTLAGEPFSKTTVGELAGDLGMTPATLAKELDTTTTEIPENATALTAPLTNGETLGVLKGLDAVTLGLLKNTGSELGKETNNETTKEHSSSEDKETTKENGGSEQKGTTKEGAGSGGSGDFATTTITVSVPLTQGVPNSSPLTTVAGSAKKAGKIKILSHRVRGGTVTLVIQVPAAGELALSGKGVKSVRRKTAKAERLTLATTLTKASAASLRRHPHKLRVKLTASFGIAGVGGSSAKLTVSFA